MTLLSAEAAPSARSESPASTFGVLHPDMAARINDAGKLLLRVVIGVPVLLHGIDKLSTGPGFVVACSRRLACRAASAIWSTSAK